MQSKPIHQYVEMLFFCVSFFNWMMTILVSRVDKLEQSSFLLIWLWIKHRHTHTQRKRDRQRDREKEVNRLHLPLTLHSCGEVKCTYLILIWISPFEICIAFYRALYLLILWYLCCFGFWVCWYELIFVSTLRSVPQAGIRF